MKVRDVLEKVSYIELTRKRLKEAMSKEENGNITILYTLAEDIDDMLENLLELWGMRELK